MKTFSHTFRCRFLLASSHSLWAQARVAASQALDFWISNAEKDVVSAAAAMPQEKYSFRPSAGEFAGVRTFGEQIKHLGANNYRMAAYILDQKPSADQEKETGPQDVQSKAQILNYVEGSSAALHRAVAQVTEANLLEPMASH